MLAVEEHLLLLLLCLLLHALIKLLLQIDAELHELGGLGEGELCGLECRAVVFVARVGK